MSDELKPCPFCGSSNIGTHHSGPPEDRFSYRQCKDCTAMGPDDCEGLNWNTRAAPAAPQAEPVAWLSSDGVVAVTNVYAVAMRANGRANWLAGYVPLYAAPPQAAEPSEALREAARMALSLLDAADSESVTKRQFEARALMARDALREALGGQE